jgi:hypothetical protein
MKYRKKPVEIEAVQWTGNSESHEALREWANGNVSLVTEGRLLCHTLEGQIYASVGDWIIKGVQGEFYPCKPAIFESTYEPV